MVGGQTGRTGLHVLRVLIYQRAALELVQILRLRLVAKDAAELLEYINGVPHLARVITVQIYMNNQRFLPSVHESVTNLEVTN